MRQTSEADGRVGTFISLESIRQGQLAHRIYLPMKTNRHRAFTLVELLVVIAIIGILMSLLMPAARRLHCLNNMKQIGLALHHYHGSIGHFPPGTLASQIPNPAAHPSFPPGQLGFGWAAHILPYLEQGRLFDKLDMSGTQAQIIFPVPQLEFTGTPVPVYMCPADPQDPVSVWGTQRAGGKMCYPGVTDSTNLYAPDPPFGDPQYTHLGNGMLFNLSAVRLEDVRDGTSNTFMCGEGTGDMKEKGLHFSWPILSISSMKYGINGPGTLPGDGNYYWISTRPAPSFSSWHPGGCNFLRADGSVNFVSENTNWSVLEAMATRHGGEIPDLDAL